MRFLVVDDELTTRELLKVILEPYGEVEIVSDGIEALRVFNLALEDRPFDLICLDIMLPKMDGQQVLKKIRAIEQQRGIMGVDGVKIIMVSALADFENVNAAFASQCTSYIAKPITANKVVRELKTLQLM
jgi:two-component system chemotaxis response regulator CheY